MAGGNKSLNKELLPKLVCVCSELDLSTEGWLLVPSSRVQRSVHASLFLEFVALSKVCVSTGKNYARAAESLVVKFCALEVGQPPWSLLRPHIFFFCHLNGVVKRGVLIADPRHQNHPTKV